MCVYTVCCLYYLSIQLLAASVVLIKVQSSNCIGSGRARSGVNPLFEWGQGMLFDVTFSLLSLLTLLQTELDFVSHFSLKTTQIRQLSASAGSQHPDTLW